MTKTMNYNLNQWEAHDEIRVEDFNADNAAIDAALKECGNCRMVAGSYTGTGTYGANNPNTLTFGERPLVLFVLGGGRQFTLLGSYTPAMALISGNSSLDYLPVTWSDYGLSWYHNTGATNQMNTLNTAYYYVALFATVKG